MYEVSPQQMPEATCALPEHFLRMHHQHKYQHKDLLGLKIEGRLHLSSLQHTAALILESFSWGGQQDPRGLWKRNIIPQTSPDKLCALQDYDRQLFNGFLAGKTPDIIITSPGAHDCVHYPAEWYHHGLEMRRYYQDLHRVRCSTASSP